MDKPVAEAPSKPERKSFVRRASDAVDYGLTYAFRALGVFVARRPWTVILLCAIITGASMMGFSKFSIEQDTDNLYTPNDAESKQNKEFVEATYGTRQDASFQIYGLDKLTDGGNVLDKAYLLEHLRSWKQIYTSSVVFEGRTYAFTDSCIKTAPGGSECKVDSILRFWNYDEATLQADNNIILTINNATITNYDGRPIPLNYVLGGVSRDQAGNIARAEVLQTVSYLVYNPVRKDGITRDRLYLEWSSKIVDLAYYDWESPILKQYVQSDGAVGNESSKAIDADIMLLTIGYILLIIYTFIALWRNSKPYQKTHMTLAGLLAVGCGIATAFGVLSGTGVKFNFVCQVLPFLLVGIGMDNVFVLISAYFQQNPDSPVDVRIGNVMASAGTAITVTSITNLIAFATNAYTNLNALYSFAIYATISIMFIYLYEITLFVALLVLEARREMRARQRGGNVHAVMCNQCCCKEDPYEQLYSSGMNGWVDPINAPTIDPVTELQDVPPKQATVQRPGSAGSDVESAMPTTISVVPQKQASVDGGLHKQTTQGTQQSSVDGTLCVKNTTTPGYCGTGPFDPHADMLATKLIARWLPAVTLHPVGKAVVLLLEALFIAAAIYGCTQVYMDFNFRKMFVPEGNWLQEAFKVQERYFYGDSVPVSAYTKQAPVGQTYFDYQDQLAALSNNMRTNPYIAPSPKWQSWYDDYISWLNTPTNPRASQLVGGRPPSAEAFNTWLREYLAGDGKSYADDVIYGSDNTTIISSRMSGFTKDIKDGSYAVDMLDSTQLTAETSAPGLQAFAYGGGFTSYEGFKSITSNTVISVITSAAAVFVIILLLLGNLLASIIVGIMVVLCDVGVFGMMHYADLQFNVVTCIVLIMAVGIAVDYSAHIMRAYLVSSGTYQERAHKALVEIGGAVWNGIMTTFLVIIPMAGATHYIFTSIFQMFVFLIWVSAWHGLVLLPVLLSFYGPASYSSSSASGQAHKSVTNSHV